MWIAEFINACVNEWPNVLDRAGRKRQSEILRIADRLERTQRIAAKMNEPPSLATNGLCHG